MRANGSYLESRCTSVVHTSHRLLLLYVYALRRHPNIISLLKRRLATQAASLKNVFFQLAFSVSVLRRIAVALDD